MPILLGCVRSVRPTRLAATVPSCVRRCCAECREGRRPGRHRGVGARGRQRAAVWSVALKQRYPGHAKQAGHIAAQCHVGAYCGRYVIVVDEDIDVSNLDEVVWAMMTRSDPATSIDIIRGAWSTPLDPRIEPEQGDRRLHQ